MSIFLDNSKFKRMMLVNFERNLNFSPKTQSIAGLKRKIFIILKNSIKSDLKLTQSDLSSSTQKFLI